MTSQSQPQSEDLRRGFPGRPANPANPATPTAPGSNGGGLFGGGIFGSDGLVNKIVAVIAWLENSGVDVTKFPEVGSAFARIFSATTGDEKLTAIQDCLRAFAAMTGGINLDDQLSATVDSVLSNAAVRAWVAGLLESNVPASALAAQDVPESVRSELVTGGFDFTTIMELVAAIKTLLELFKKFKGE